MALNFPDAPGTGDTYGDWQYDGGKWVAAVGALPVGDITGVIAGTGLSGGGSTGDVTLSLATPVPIAQGGTGQTSAASALTALGGLSTTTAASTYLPVAGGTITGDNNLTLSPPTNWAILTLNKPAGSYMAQVRAHRAGVMRWEMALADNTAESGSNSGSNFILHRYADAGTWIAPALTIIRSTGDTTINGACFNTTGTWTAISSAELKEDVQAFDRGLEAVLALRPVTFRYRAGTPFAMEEASAPILGLIAEEVQPHLPELCGTTTVQVDGEDREVATVQPGHLVYALLNAVRELAARVEELEARAE